MFFQSIIRGIYILSKTLIQLKAMRIGAPVVVTLSSSTLCPIIYHIGEHKDSFGKVSLKMLPFFADLS